MRLRGVSAYDADMSTHPDLTTETHIMGESTVLAVVRAEQCEALASRQIAHVAVADAAAPFSVVRTHLSGAYFQVCLSGSGQTFLDGEWHEHGPGIASFSPAHVLHAFHCVAPVRWKVAWVRFMPNSQRSVDGALSPTMFPFDGELLAHAVLGLAREMQGAGDPGNCTVWVEVIDRYMTGLLDPLLRAPRLVALWNTVRADLARDWTLSDMAKVARTSEEHLRRLCQRNLGRSPGKQLTTLRVAQAAHLLVTTADKIESIAQQVGYANSFAFSNTFKRVTGLRPSEFRHRPRKAAAGETDLH